MSDRRITIRRQFQQAIHCLEEARDVLGEDPRAAVDDIEQAGLLLLEIRRRVGEIEREARENERR